MDNRTGPSAAAALAAALAAAGAAAAFPAVDFDGTAGQPGRCIALGDDDDVLRKRTMDHGDGCDVLRCDMMRRCERIVFVWRGCQPQLIELSCRTGTALEGCANGPEACLAFASFL